MKLAILGATGQTGEAIDISEECVEENESDDDLVIVREAGGGAGS